MCAEDEETNRFCTYSAPAVNFLPLCRLINRMCTEETNGFHTYSPPTSNSLLMPTGQTAASHSIMVVMPRQRPVSSPPKATPSPARAALHSSLAKPPPRIYVTQIVFEVLFLFLSLSFCALHDALPPPLHHFLIIFFPFFLPRADKFVRPRGIKPRRGQMVSHWVHGGRCWRRSVKQEWTRARAVC